MDQNDDETYFDAVGFESLSVTEEQGMISVTQMFEDSSLQSRRTSSPRDENSTGPDDWTVNDVVDATTHPKRSGLNCPCPSNRQSPTPNMRRHGKASDAASTGKRRSARIAEMMRKEPFQNVAERAIRRKARSFPVSHSPYNAGRVTKLVRGKSKSKKALKQKASSKRRTENKPTARHGSRRCG